LVLLLVQTLPPPRVPLVPLRELKPPLMLARLIAHPHLLQVLLQSPPPELLAWQAQPQHLPC
jgi:hypothetical protein